MKAILLKKLKHTLYEYEVDLSDPDLKSLVNRLKPIFKEDILDQLPTNKEIDAELEKQPAMSSNYANGIAQGAKKIIKQIQKL